MDPREPRPRPFPGDKPPKRAREETPELSLGVVEWLERLYPEVYALPGENHGALMFHLGCRAVARRVRAEYTRQNEES